VLGVFPACIPEACETDEYMLAEEIQPA